MAKADLIQEIKEQNPDLDLTAVELDEKYTVPELEKLQQDLLEKNKETEGETNSEPPQPKKVKKYKLKDPSTQYAEGSFSLAGKQEKELPENPSGELLARVRAGFIVEVK